MLFELTVDVSHSPLQRNFHMTAFNFSSGSTINTFVPDADVISFPAGASAINLSFSQSGSSLIIYSTLGSITVSNLTYAQLRTGSLTFADGSMFYIGTSPADVLTGSVGNDYMDGMDGNDSLQGGNGTDKLYGSDGDDILVGGAGYDSLYGGAGDDYFDSSLIAPGETVVGDYIRPGTGSNTIVGNAALFVALQGLEISYADVATSGGLVISVGDNGTGTTKSVNAGVVNDTFSYAYYFQGTHEVDSMTGSSNIDYEGWSGLAGNDTLDGGLGYDELNYQNDSGWGGTAAVNVNFSTGKAQDGFGNTDTIINMEAARGTSKADVFTGSSSIAFLSYRGLAGNDTFIGSSAIDRVDYNRDVNAGGTAGVTVNLDTGVAIDGFGNTDTLTNIDNVRATNQADSVVGNSGSNRLDGLSGNDSLNGQGGDDQLIGGGGGDTIDGAGGTDTAVFSGTISDYFISYNRALATATITDQRTNADGTDTLKSIEKLQFSDKTFDLINLPPTGTPGYGKIESFLFDAVYYLLKNPELVPTVTLATAYDNYKSVGAASGDAPNAWFDPVYYANKWADLTPLNLDAATLFQHYNLFGVWEGRSAGPTFDHFDGNKYLSDYPDVAAYVDAYVADFLGSRTNGAIAHYVIYGANEGRVAYDTVGVAIDPAILIGVSG